MSDFLPDIHALRAITERLRAPHAAAMRAGTDLGCYASSGAVAGHLIGLGLATGGWSDPKLIDWTPLGASVRRHLIADEVRVHANIDHVPK